MSKQVQTQVSKTVAKVNPGKVSPVNAMALDAEIAALATLASPTLAFKLIDGIRPQRGLNLFAHTCAFFKLTGMDAGQALPRATLVRSMGQSAVNYHLKSTGHFEDTPEGIKLSIGGLCAFTLRDMDQKQATAEYIKVLSTGEMNDVVSPKVSQPFHVAKLA